MSYISKREKILFDRFFNAEQIRKAKQQDHFLIEKNRVDVRYSLERAGEQIFRLEKSLKEISQLREKRSLLKEMEKTSERVNQSLILRNKIRNQIIEQQVKLKSKSRKLSPLRQESDYKKHHSPSNIESNASSFSPLKKPPDFLSPELIKKIRKPGF